MEKYKNILVVRTDRIGDVALTTPALLALKQYYKKSRLSIMVTPFTRDIVEGNPNIDEVIVYDKNGKNRGILGYWRFIAFLRKKKFDLAIVYHTKQRTNLMCFLAGISKRIGYRNNKFGFLLTDGIKDDRPEGKKHEAQYCLDVLKHLGIESNDCTNIYMPISDESAIWAKDFLHKNNVSQEDTLVAIHPGGSDHTKRWPPEKFKELISLMAKKYSVKFVLVGANETRGIADIILKDAQKPIVDAIGQTSVGQLAGLLSNCQLLISNDSGPVHIGCAVGIPVVSIFGHRRRGLSHIRWRPLGPHDVAIHKEEGCDVCRNNNAEACLSCLQSIKAEEILRVIEPIMQ